MTFRWPRRRTEWLAFAIFVPLVVVLGLGIWWVSRYSVAVSQLTRGIGDTMFYGADDTPWFRLDEQRHDVHLADISLNLQQAVVAIEDRRFYLHPGIDAIGIARAAVRDLRKGGAVEGGSTLTQQLARTLFLSHVRTFGRKAKEAGIALLIEAQLTKPQILELYLNRVYLSAGVYGVEAMSEHLFRKSSKDLTLAEAALIAGLIRAPSALSPWSNYDAALDRSRVVLAAMRDQHFVTADEEAAARQVRPTIRPYRSAEDARGGWAKEFLRQQFQNEFGGDHPPDWRVRTSFQPAFQDAAERAVAAGLQRLKRPDLEAALVAIDPATGNLLAMVGGGDFTRSTFNRATRSRRQPGSAFKPLVYAAALAHGYSPVSVLTDLDRVGAADDPEWRPTSVNHGDADAGAQRALTLRVALTESNNAAAVRLQQLIGSAEVLKLASSAGLNDLPDVPSLALGAGVVTPLALTAAYTMFPGAGEVVRPRGMVAVYNGRGEQIYDRPVERSRIVSAPVAFQMTMMLRDVVDKGTAAATRALGVTGPVAGKTGTTDDYHDAWFVGFSSSVVVGVWVGLDQPAPIGRDAYGARIALPIWADFMKRTARGLPARPFPIPDGIRAEQLCSVSHLKPVDECPVYSEYFKDGDDIPSELCPVHRGTLKQAATRAVEGFFRGLGGKISGLFKRRE